MTSPAPRTLLAAYAAVVGLAAGCVAAAAFVACGVAELEGPRGAAEECVVAVALAVMLGSAGRWKTGGRPRVAAIAVALLLVFASRRWLTAWVNLAPLGWKSGTAGLVPAVTLPLLGLLLGALFGVDAGAPSGATDDDGARRE